MSKSTDGASAVWSKENRYHLHKEGVQHPNASTLSAPQDTQQQHQPPSQQQISIDQLPEGDPTTKVAAIFASQPQMPSAHYQRVFGQPLPIVGPNQFVLDEEFRAAAKKSPMLWAFIQAIDQAEEELQKQVEELH
jgi:hypothetical protein